MVESFEDSRDERVFPIDEAAVSLGIVFPEKLKELNLDDDFYNDLEDRMRRNAKGKHWKNYAGIAANIKILFPEKSKKLDISNKFWENMRQQMAIYREIGNWKDLAALAKSMKILAAEDVKITDEGLEITMHGEEKSFKDETPKKIDQYFIIGVDIG